MWIEDRETKTEMLMGKKHASNKATCFHIVISSHYHRFFAFHSQTCICYTTQSIQHTIELMFMCVTIVWYDERRVKENDAGNKWMKKKKTNGSSTTISNDLENEASDRVNERNNQRLICTRFFFCSCVHIHMGLSTHKHMHTLTFILLKLFQLMVLLNG